MQPFIVGVRFQKVGKLYHFDASKHREIKPGDFVVVETARGSQLGEVIQTFETPPPPPPDGYFKAVDRPATPRDLVLRQYWQQKELEATINCRAKLAELNVPGVKIVGSEYSYDGSRLAFLYSSETGDKVDLRPLRSTMQRSYSRTKVEMRQIGPRDVAKILGGMGACGLANRCCSMFLTEFSPVSIKMAKDQGISLSPSEITGMCGRLRCCLVYEYEQYVEARKQLPKRNKRVISPAGEGKVIDIYPLKESVMVELDDGKRAEFMRHELQPWDELEALRRKSQAPCDRHEGGGCDCGKAGKPKLEAKVEASDYAAELDFMQPDEEMTAKEPESKPAEVTAPRSAEWKGKPGRGKKKKFRGQKGGAAGKAPGSVPDTQNRARKGSSRSNPPKQAGGSSDGSA